MSDELQKKLNRMALEASLPASRGFLPWKPYRFIFDPKHKPWHWFFTWWLRRWHNYGDFIPIEPDDPRYETAPYEMVLLYSEKLHSEVVQ